MEIKQAIKILKTRHCTKNHFCRDGCMYGPAECEYGLAITALEEKAERENMRCENCKYYQDNNNGYPNADCKWNSNETPNSDDFCSYFEPKESVKKNDLE